MKNKRIRFILGSLLGASCLVSLAAGSANFPLLEIGNALLGKPGYEAQRIILFSLRLPRLLGAIIAGAGLSVSGVLLQIAMGNHLAGPNIIGVNGGAGLALVICIAYFPAFSRLLPLAAFLGALLASLCILIISRLAGSSRGTVILIGAALSALFQSIISFIASINSDVMGMYAAFSQGSLNGLNSEKLIGPAALIGITWILAILLSMRIQTLALGDPVSASLGIHTGLLRGFCLMLASLCAACVVSYAGLIGFVGLIVPHIARRLTGEGIRSQLRTAPIAGAVLTVLADLLGRTLFSPSEVAVGIVLSFIGAPFLIVLLIRQRRRKNE